MSASWPLYLKLENTLDALVHKLVETHLFVVGKFERQLAGTGDLVQRHQRRNADEQAPAKRRLRHRTFISHATIIVIKSANTCGRNSLPKNAKI